MNNDYDFIKGQMILKINGIAGLSNVLPLTRESLYTLDGSIRSIPELSAPVEPIPIADVKKATNDVITLVTTGGSVGIGTTSITVEKLSNLAVKALTPKAEAKNDATKANTGVQKENEALQKTKTDIEKTLEGVDKIIKSDVLNDFEKIIPTVTEAFVSIKKFIPPAPAPPAPAPPAIAALEPSRGDFDTANTTFNTALDFNTLKTTTFAPLKTVVDSLTLTSYSGVNSLTTAKNAVDTAYNSSSSSDVISKVNLYITAFENYNPSPAPASSRGTPALPVLQKTEATAHAERIKEKLKEAVTPIKAAAEEAVKAMKEVLKIVEQEAAKKEAESKKADAEATAAIAKFTKVDTAKTNIDSGVSDLKEITKDSPYEEVDREIGDRIDRMKALIRLCQQAEIEEKEVQPIYNKIAEIEYQRMMMAFGPAIRSYFEGFLEFLKNRLDAGDKTVKDAKDWSTLVTEYIDNYVKKFRYGSKSELVLLLDITLAENLVYNNLENSLNLMSMLETKFKANIGAKPEDEQAFAAYKKVLKSLVDYMKADEGKSQFQGRQPGESYTAYTDRRRKFIRDFVDKVYAQEGDRITPGTPMGKPVKGMVDSQYEAATNFLKGIFDERMTIAEETAKNPVAKSKLMSTLNSVRAREEQKEKALKTIQYKLTGLPVPLDTPPAGWKKIVGSVNAEIAARGVDNMRLDDNVTRGGAAPPAPIAIKPLQKFVDDLFVNAPVEKLMTNPTLLSNLLKDKDVNDSLKAAITASINEYTKDDTKMQTILEKALKDIDLSTHAETIANAVYNSSPTKKAIAQIVLNFVRDEINAKFANAMSGKEESIKNALAEDPVFQQAVSRNITLPPAAAPDPGTIATQIIGDSNIKQDIINKAAYLFMNDPNKSIDIDIERNVNGKIDGKVVEEIETKIAAAITPDLLIQAIESVYAVEGSTDGHKQAFADAIFNSLVSNPEQYNAFREELIKSITASSLAKETVQGIIFQQLGLTTGESEENKKKVVAAIAEHVLGSEGMAQAIEAAKNEISDQLKSEKAAIALDEGLTERIAAEVTNQLRVIQGTVDGFSTKLATLTDQQATLNRELTALRTEREALNARIDAIPKTDTAALDGLEAYKQSINERITQIEEAQSKIAKSIEQVAQQLLPIEDNTNKNVTDISALQARLDEMSKTLEDLQKNTNQNLAVLVKGMIGVTSSKDDIKLAGQKAIEEAWNLNANASMEGGADEPSAAPGAGTPDVALLPKDNAKKQLGTLDQVKKEVRGILDALDGILKTYTDTFEKFFKDVSTTSTSTPASTPATQPAAQGKGVVVKVEISKEDQELLGEYKTLQEDGQKWVKDVEDTIKDKKSAVENVLKLLQSVFESEPANKKYIDYGTEVKVLFEGNYQAAKDSKDAKGLLTLLQSIPQEIKNIYENRIRDLKPKALAVEQKIQLEKEKLQAQARSGRNMQPYPGGSRKRVMKGGEPPVFPETIDHIQKKLTDVVMQKIVKDLDSIYLRQSNPVMAAAVSEPSIFAGIYNDYLDRRNAVGTFVASKELSQQLHNNALIPREVLAVTKLDKTVFVFVTLFIRLFALTIAEYTIEKGVINTMPKALAMFVGLYLLIFVLFVVLVNLDVYRMRIIFNYVNFHANSGLVYSHIGMLVLFTTIIYIIMRNVNFPIKGIEVKAITEEEKSNLIYRLEVLTMIVWLFLVILIAVM